MLEIVGLILTSKEINKLALLKGLKPGIWVVFTIICWFSLEFFGVVLGVILFHSRDIIALEMLGLISGFWRLFTCPLHFTKKTR